MVEASSLGELRVMGDPADPNAGQGQTLGALLGWGPGGSSGPPWVAEVDSWQRGRGSQTSPRCPTGLLSKRGPVTSPIRVSESEPAKQGWKSDDVHFLFTHLKNLWLPNSLSYIN